MFVQVQSPEEDTCSEVPCFMAVFKDFCDYDNALVYFINHLKLHVFEKMNHASSVNK